jgi:prolipoprotein diacylglyceryltransferase
MVGVLLLIDWRFRIRAPGLFALYVAFYTFGRFFEELLRIDPAHHIAGLRLNAWVSVILFVLSTAFFIWWQFFGGKFKSWRRKERAGDDEPDRPKMAIPKGRVRPGN